MKSWRQHALWPLLLLLLTAVAAQADSEAPRTFEQLAQRFKKAHEAGDYASIAALVCWTGTDDTTKKAFEKHTRADFGLKITNVSLKPLGNDDVLEYRREGVLYRPNITTVGFLQVDFAPPEQEGSLFPASTSYLVGVKDGHYLIATSAPVHE